MSRDRLKEITSGTFLKIDLDAYRDNLHLVRDRVGPETHIMAVIKANAYGHGAVECADEALRAGCRYLGVARIDEALHLRNHGVSGPILVIGPPNNAQIDLALSNDIALTVATPRSSEEVIASARRLGKQAVVHLKVDTGLRRYGAKPDVAIGLAARLSRADQIELEGVYTHFSSSDELDPAPTQAQIREFVTVTEEIRRWGIRVPMVHVANSAAIMTGLLSSTTMVRAGIITYGLDPSDEVPAAHGCRQILSLYSVTTRRFNLLPGETVSYNRTYEANVEHPAAAVPIGYADGIERHLSNAGWFTIEGERCPIIGRVCMDQTVIQVSERVQEGDLVTIVGPGDRGEMTVADLARICGTNTYEPVTRMAARIPRIFVREGVPYRWSVPLLGESGFLNVATDHVA